MGVCNCSMFCCTLLYVHSSIAIILMGKRELIALLNLSSWCLVMVERLFLAVPRGCLQFVIVVFPDHTHLLFYKFNLGLCLNNQVKEKQWKWSIVIPYNVYQQQFPQNCQKKCSPIVIVCNFKKVLCSNGCFYKQFSTLFY